jgi:hypothetical protein
LSKQHVKIPAHATLNEKLETPTSTYAHTRIRAHTHIRSVCPRVYGGGGWGGVGWGERESVRER